jgi:hypothetical protein
MNPELKLPETPQEIAEVLADGVNLRVEFSDQNVAPTIVKVRKVARRDFPIMADAILNAVADETAEAAFYCDRTPAWAESLSDESFEAVMREGRRLNFTRFSAWFGRRQDVLNLAKVQAPELDKITAAVTKAMDSRKSTSS